MQNPSWEEKKFLFEGLPLVLFFTFSVEKLKNLSKTCLTKLTKSKRMRPLEWRIKSNFDPSYFCVTVFFNYLREKKASRRVVEVIIQKLRKNYPKKMFVASKNTGKFRPKNFLALKAKKFLSAPFGRVSQHITHLIPKHLSVRQNVFCRLSCSSASCAAQIPERVSIKHEV